MKIDPHARFPKRECPGCAVEVPANENRCPVCGYEFPVQRPLHRNLWWIALLVLALLLLPLLHRLRVSP
ncbi:MAG: zinc ribbon domain-containing protein [Lentisphaerae bacterium]|nr:zinc ribbon domain-containing protein [Lentisphaerota bacterium]